MTISKHAMRISSHVIDQTRVSGRTVERNTWLNVMPRPTAWIITVVATRHEAIKSFAIIAALIFSWLVTGVFLKIFDRVRDASEAVDAAQFGIHTFVAKSVAYGRACFDGLESDTFGSEVIGQFAECLRALQV